MEKEAVNFSESLNDNDETHELQKDPEKAPEVEEQEDIPEDPMMFNYFLFLLMGIVLVLPLNSLIQAISFFEANLPGRDIEFVVGTLVNGPVFLGQVMMLLIGRCLNTKITIVLSLYGMSVMSFAIPFITEYIENTDVLWYIVLASIFVFCLFTGFYQSSGRGFNAIFPKTMVASFSNGTGFSGMLVGVLRAMALGVFPVDETLPRDPNMFAGTKLYFGISAGLLFVCATLTIFSYRTGYNSYYYEQSLKKKSNKDTKEERQTLIQSAKTFAMTPDNTIVRPPKEDGAEEEEEQKVSVIKIHNENWMNFWGIFLNFSMQFAIFPGLFINGDITFVHDYHWRIWFIIFMSVVFDAFGRVAAGFVTLKSPLVAFILTL